MREPDGLLGLAQHMRGLFELDSEAALSDALELARSFELCAALSGGSPAALEWASTLHPPPHIALPEIGGDFPLADAVRANQLELIRIICSERSIAHLLYENLDLDWFEVAVRGLRVARKMQNWEMIRLIFPLTLETFDGRRELLDIKRAVRANDPFTRRYLFQVKPKILSARSLMGSQFHWHEGLPLVMYACMTGRRDLLNDVWRFTRFTFQRSPDLFHVLGPRVGRALRLCTEGDLTPVMTVLMPDWYELPSYVNKIGRRHPMVHAARCGHLPAVRLWLAQGVPAQLALLAAVKHGRREVVDCLIKHGANPSKLSSSSRQLLQALMHA